MIWFEQQFNNREKIKSHAGTVEFIDISSPHVKNPHVIFLVFGWGETFQSIKPTLASIAIGGYRIIVAMYESLDKNLNSVDTHPSVEYVKALAIKDILKYKNIKNIDIIGHSEGAIIASLLAQNDQNLIKSLTLISPAGIDPKINIGNLSFRFVKYLFNEFFLYLNGEYRAGLIYIGGLFRYVILNPIQSIKEVLGLANFRITPIIKKISKNKSVFIIYSLNDSLFSQNEVELMINDINFEKKYEVIGVHNEIHVHPQKLVQILNDIFNVHLAKKRSFDLSVKRDFYTVIADIIYFLTRKIFGPIVRLIWIKKVAGLENIPKKGPVIIAFNHESYFDFICFMAVSPRNVYYLAAEKFFTNPFWKILMYATGQIRVDRKKKDKRNVHELVKLQLNQNKIVGIFPEGTRAPSKEVMLRAFSGIAKFSIKEKVPIIPVGLKGTFDVMSRFDKKPKFRKVVEIYVGNKINFDGYHIKFNHKGYALFTDKVMREISVLSSKPYPHSNLKIKKHA